MSATEGSSEGGELISFLRGRSITATSPRDLALVRYMLPFAVVRRPLVLGSCVVLAILACGFGNGCGSKSGARDSGSLGGGGGQSQGGGQGGGGGSTGGSIGGGGQAGTSTDAGSAHDTAGTLHAPCWTETDCAPSGNFCIPPDRYRCGSVCVTAQPPCTTDSDCVGIDAAWTGPSICDAVICGCSAANRGCQVGCTRDGDCLAGTTCGSDHHCASIACTPTSGSCPTDFICGSAGICARKTCSSDTECSNACVEGACYESPGSCDWPANA
jgi:hypothetical protein